MKTVQNTFQFKYFYLKISHKWGGLEPVGVYPDTAPVPAPMPVPHYTDNNSVKNQ
jgi:hypothetical protein